MSTETRPHAKLLSVGLWILAESVLLWVSQISEASASDQHAPQVYLVAESGVRTDPSHTFVVTHGCGGTSEGDRFHRLATLLKREYLTANVYRLDWSGDACETTFGFPNPWAVAKKIGPTGDAAADLLRRQGVAASQLTLIGESFGVYVNDRIAEDLGGVDATIGCNPANEVGGYLPPNLRRHARHNCVLTTDSPFDTRLDIAEFEFELKTDASMSALEQHTFGINWLCGQLDSSCDSFVAMSFEAGPATADMLSGTILPDGTIDDSPVPRARPPLPRNDAAISSAPVVPADRSAAAGSI